jgi:hypothetical protein
MKISRDFLNAGDCRWLLLTENLTHRSASGISPVFLETYNCPGPQHFRITNLFFDLRKI